MTNHATSGNGGGGAGCSPPDSPVVSCGIHQGGMSGSGRVDEDWERRIREIVREEILAASRASDTLPCPPPGDSHSGAIVVPRGSSRPPAMRRDDACGACGMICCVCPHRFGYPADGSDGEGGP